MRGMISPGRQRAFGGIELKMQAFAAAARQVELVELLHVLDAAANLFGGVRVGWRLLLIFDFGFWIVDWKVGRGLSFG